MRPVLAFLFRQGWPEETQGLDADADVDAMLRRIVAALQPFEAEYQTCLIVNPQAADWQQTVRFLRRVRAAGLRVCLSLLDSDCIAMEWKAWNRPYDAGHCVALPWQLAQALIEILGDSLVGFRAHELLSIRQTVLAGMAGLLNWWAPWQYLVPPDGNVIHWPTVRKLVEIAARAGKWVFFTGPLWSGNLGRWPSGLNAAALAEDERALWQVMREFPGVVHVGFSNNVNARDMEHAYWPLCLRPTLQTGLAGGYGVELEFPWSGLSWEELADWAWQAATHGARVISFEAGYELFDSVPGSPMRGAARPGFLTLARRLAA
jgi:hypothetical protein